MSFSRPQQPEYRALVAAASIEANPISAEI
jgi:hypothetical protein